MLAWVAWIACAWAADDAPGPRRVSADPVPITDVDALATPIAPKAAARGVVYVNFDGATLAFGQDDATADRTILEELAGPFPSFGGSSQRAATLQAVQLDFSPYDVVVVDNRPSAGAYTMAMVGPHDAGTVLGIAPLDCFDEWPSNIVFAFHSDGDNYSASSKANTISQEVAHSYGLEHVDHAGDIMYPVSSGGDPAFLDQCLPIVPAPDIACGQQHAEHCPDAQQNSHRELLRRFGPATPVEPEDGVIAITSPADGDELDVGEPFEIVAQSVDGRDFANVVLFVNEANIGGRTEAPYTWAVDGLTEGVWQAYVIGVDASGLMSRSEPVEIFVGLDNPDRDDGGGCRVARGPDGGPTGGPGWSAGVFAVVWLIRRRRCATLGPT